MKKIILHIKNLYDSKTVEVGDEISVGRTNASQVVLDDAGLSRKNTTFFRDGDDFLVVDENSLNGTFLNGTKISGAPRIVEDGDEITIGTDTQIRVEIAAPGATTKKETVGKETTGAAEQKQAQSKTQTPEVKPQTSSAPPMILIVAVGSLFLIIFFGGIALFVASSVSSNSTSSGGKSTPPISQTIAIPIRVIDPLGGQDPDDLDDILAAWEVEDKGAAVEDLKQLETTTSSGSTNTSLINADELNVKIDFWTAQRNLALQARSKPTGERPPGLFVTPVIYDNTYKQSLKLKEMINANYKLPLDYADLAKKRLDGDLIELPLATKTYVLEVGEKANEDPFYDLFWEGNTPKKAPIQPGSEKHNILKKLSENFSGQKYNMDDPKDRKQMKIRLLRMFNWRAKPILEKLAGAYYEQYKRPLRVTSLSRSMEYQILLGDNANSYKVKSAGALPPHTSGCAFDLARKHMDVEEQNFMIKTLERMELGNELNAIIEFNVNACFHVFIFFDGKPPKT